VTPATVAVVLVVAAVVVGLAWLGARPSDLEARVAELQAAEAERDARISGELVATTRQAHELVLPVVESLDEALPADGSAGSPAAPEETSRWAAAVADAAELYADPESAGTSVNVARAGLQQAVTQLGRAVEAYQQALTLPEQQRTPWLELAGSLRTDAVVVWSIAATQLDDLSVGANQGHVHLYLPAAPGSGAMTAEGHSEGTAP
jgi:hypothetical protein